MAAQAGKDVLIYNKNNAGSPAYEALAGLRTKSIELNAETVDVTNSDSTGMWRELLAGAGVKSARISGAGVFIDSAAENEVLEAFNAGEIRDVKIVVPGLGYFEGKFQCTQCQWAGEYNREVSYQMTWESGGQVVFTGA